jgi:tRNA-dihydrouridine synthase
MDLREEILGEVERFLSSQQLGPSTFGRAALGDPNFVRELREGRRIWPDTAEKVRRFMRGYWRKATP